jgi:hypothetical protein
MLLSQTSHKATVSSSVCPFEPGIRYGIRFFDGVSQSSQAPLPRSRSTDEIITPEGRETLEHTIQACEYLICLLGASPQASCLRKRGRVFTAASPLWCWFSADNTKEGRSSAHPLARAQCRSVKELSFVIQRFTLISVAFVSYDFLSDAGQQAAKSACKAIDDKIDLLMMGADKFKMTIDELFE